VIQTLDYARPELDRPGFGKWALACVLLAVFLVGYGFLCAPWATRNMDYRIDDIWVGALHLWIFPLLLLVLYLPPGRFFRGILVAYAILSGLCSVQRPPRGVEWTLICLIVILTIAFHIAIACAIVLGARFAITRVYPHAGEHGQTQRTFRRASVAFIVVLVAAAFPFGYRSTAIAVRKIVQRRHADADWRNHTAAILKESPWDVNGFHSSSRISISSWVDGDSGLPIRVCSPTDYQAEYVQRIDELLKAHGVTAWSQKERVVSEADFATMLTAKMTQITVIPYDVTPGIEVNGGTVVRWNGIVLHGGNDRFIKAKYSGTQAFQRDSICPGTFTNAYFARLPRYPGVVFVRFDDDLVVACTDDGWILGYALAND